MARENVDQKEATKAAVAKAEKRVTAANAGEKIAAAKAEKKPVREYRTRFQQAFSVLLLPALLFGVLGPLEIFAGNTEEFAFGFHDFFWLFLLLAMVVLLLFALLIAALPERGGYVVQVLAFLLGIECYLQNVFFNRKLFQEDGSRMNWDALREYTWVNLALWAVLAVAILFFCLREKHLASKVMMATCLFLSALQLVSVVALLISVPKTKSGEIIYNLDRSEQFHLASGHNVIVLILDRYGNELFERNLAEQPELLEALKDFTYYSNAASVDLCTFPSIVETLTMAPFAGSEQEYSEYAWTDPRASEIYEALHQKGYNCRLYSAEGLYYMGNVQSMEGKLDNVVQMERGLNRGRMLYLLEKMTLYKYLPYIAKPYFEVMSYHFESVVQNPASISENGKYYEALRREGLKINEDYANFFVVQHLSGVHDPFLINEEARYTGEETSPEAVSKGLTVIVAEYLAQLKELGLYDSATIFIFADHGATDLEIGPQPIFLVKEAGQSYPAMQENTAPIWHTDFMPTVLQAIGEDAASYGTTIYDWKETDLRERSLHRAEQTIAIYSTVEELYEQVVEWEAENATK